MFLTIRKRSLRRLCFYTCLSVILFTEGVFRPRNKGEVGESAWGVSRSRPRGEVGGSARGISRPRPGGFPGPGPGLSRPRPRPRGCVSQHALRQTPPGRRLLLWTVRILLECILVQNYFLILVAHEILLW